MVFFIRRFGEPRLRFDLRAKKSNPGKFPGNFQGNFPVISREISPDFPGKFPRNFPGNLPGLSREISPQFHGKFPRTFQGNFPAISREISRGIFEGKMIECAYRFNAPHAMMMVNTTTLVLHDVCKVLVDGVCVCARARVRVCGVRNVPGPRRCR